MTNSDRMNLIDKVTSIMHDTDKAGSLRANVTLTMLELSNLRLALIESMILAEKEKKNESC